VIRGLSVGALSGAFGMHPYSLKIMQCFLKIREVHHYYWAYTSADDADGKVSIENLQRIVERLTRKKIKIDTVDFVGVRTLSVLERFDDRFEIHIREKVPSPEWYRVGAVKEFWHAVSDVSEDLSTDGVKTIYETVTARGKINWEKLSPQARSEKLAEIFVGELLYPIEYRTKDMERRAGGVSIEEIAKMRSVPPWIVETALEKENYAFCFEWWSNLDTTTTYKPLEPLEGEVA
jgi:hypothetical protein